MLNIDIKVDDSSKSIKLRTSIRLFGNRSMVLGYPGDLVPANGVRNIESGVTGEYMEYVSPARLTNYADSKYEDAKFKALVGYYQNLANKYGSSRSNEHEARELPGTIAIDKDWIASRFMVPKIELLALDAINADVSIGSWKITNTTLGYSLACNPRPQFTRYADIKLKSVYQDVLGNKDVDLKEAPAAEQGNYTMGRYYSESIDDNAMLVFLQFGVPKFNNLLTFILRAVSYEDTFIANHGVYPTGYEIGKWAGNFAMFCAFPLITMLVHTVKTLTNFFFGGAFSYYYFQPSMPAYWATVSTMVNQLASELGILPVFLKSDNEAGKLGIPAGVDKATLLEWQRIFPEFYKFGEKTSYIDVLAIAGSAQDRANAISKAEFANKVLGDESMGNRTGEELNNMEEAVSLKGLNLTNILNIKEVSSKGILKHNDGSIIGALDVLFSLGSNITKDPNGIYGENNHRSTEIRDNKSSIEEKKKNNANTNATDQKQALTRDKDDGRYKNGYIVDEKRGDSYVNDFIRFFSASARDGGAYAIFHVDYIGSVGESFSNSTGEIESNGLIKSAASGARNVSFNLSGGNIIPGSADLFATMNNIVIGALDGVTFGLSSTIAAVLNGAFVDMPKKWEDSDFSPTSTSYKITLISPYGNIFAQLQNIYIPLCMLIAGVAPQATGKSSYSSPFLCTLFNKGVQDIKLGMITSLSITRGTSNLGFNRLRRPLAIEVNFTVTDLNIRPAAPVNPSFLKEFNIELDDTSPMSVYLATLASRDLYTQKYTMPKLKLKLARLSTSIHRMVSPATLGMGLGSSALAQNTLGVFGQSRILNISLLNP